MVAFKEQSAPMVARIQMIDNATQRLARADDGHASTVATD
jgi:hypothetical protein